LVGEEAALVLKTFNRSLTLAALISAVATLLIQRVGAQTVINVPPSPSPTSAGAGTTVNLLDGGSLANQFDGLNGSTLNVSGGLANFVRLFTGATANVYGGEVWSIDGVAGATANIYGGLVHHLNGDEAAYNVYGGEVVAAHVQGPLHVYGGRFDDDHFQVRIDGQLFVHGTDFRIDGVPVNGLASEGDSKSVAFLPGSVISGVYSDGVPFVFSADRGEVNSPVMLVKSAAYSLQPTNIVVPTDAAPEGIHDGQTLTLLDGGALGPHFTVGTGSSLIVQGGIIGRNVEVIGATVDATGGALETFNVFRGGVVNFGGNSSWDDVTLFPGAVANFHDDQQGGNVDARPGTVVNIHGGKIAGSVSVEESTANVTGGVVGNLLAYGATTSISGGASLGSVSLRGDSTLNASNADLGDLQLYDTSTATVDRVNIDRLLVLGGSAVVESASINQFDNWSGSSVVHGGAIGDNLEWISGTVELHGYDFQVDGVDVSGLVNAGDSIVFNYSPGSFFTGTLADGSALAISFESDNPSFNIAAGAVRLVRSEKSVFSIPIIVNSDVAPYGASSGQNVIIESGGKVAPNFVAGRGSVVEIRGGSVGENFEAERSQVLISGGAVGEEMDVFKGAVVEVAGGSVGPHWEVHPHGELRLSGGLLGSQGTLRGGTLNVSGGFAGSIDALDQSIVDVSGGEIGSELELQGGSQANVTGGLIGFNFRVGTTSTTHIAGGQLREVELQQTGRGEFTGGVVDRLNVAAGAVADIRGGAFGDGFNVSTGAMATLHGADFEINGVPVDGLVQAGDQVTLTVANNQLFTGTLADGTPFAFDSRESDHPHVVTLTRAPLAAAPSVVEVDSPGAPLGVRAGQQLNLRAGGQLADSFNVGRGAELNVYDGVVGKNLEAFAATVNVHGGQIGADFDAFAGSTVNVDGGSIGTNFDLYSGATLNFNGGYAFQVDSLGGTVAMEGGKIRSLAMSAAANVDWRGGVIDAFSFNGSSSSLDVFGVDFKLNGVPIAGMTSVGDSVPFNPTSSDVLTGVLADGTPMVYRGLQSGVPSGVIRLNRSALPAPNLPAFQQVLDANAPFAIGAGQTLQLDAAGILGDGFIAGPGSKLLVDDGTVGVDVKAFGSEVRIAGGLVKGNVQFFDNVDADVYGGTFLGNFPLIGAGSDVTLHGTQFFLNNAPISGLGAPGTSLVLNQRAGQMLKAILTDGSTLQWRLQPFTAGGRGGPAAGISASALLRIQMIPEPAAIQCAAIALGTCAVYFRRRSSR
jgi:hypothetical protein